MQTYANEHSHIYMYTISLLFLYSINIVYLHSVVLLKSVLTEVLKSLCLLVILRVKLQATWLTSLTRVNKTSCFSEACYIFYIIHELFWTTCCKWTALVSLNQSDWQLMTVWSHLISVFHWWCHSSKWWKTHLTQMRSIEDWHFMTDNKSD